MSTLMLLTFGSLAVATGYRLSIDKLLDEEK